MFPCASSADSLGGREQATNVPLASQDFFPWVYWHGYVKVRKPAAPLPSSNVREGASTDLSTIRYPEPQGKWFGSRGPFRPVDYFFNPSA